MQNPTDFWDLFWLIFFVLRLFSLEVEIRLIFPEGEILGLCPEKFVLRKAGVGKNSIQHV